MSEEKVTEGSGNIFADIGMKNPEEWQCKANLAAEIISIIKNKDWDQTTAANYLGIKQVEVSNINRGQFDRFTIDRLMQYLLKLDRDVQILITPCKEEHKGHLAVKCG